MSTVKSDMKKFLEKSKILVEPDSAVDEFVEILKRENIRQIKAQLAADLAPLLARLNHIEQQQSTIIDLLKKKMELDAYEKEIMDLLKKKLESA